LGSGIVADSDPETEWQETQLKGEFVTLQPRDFILYETIRFDQRKKEKGKRIKESQPISGSSFLLSPFSFLDLRSHLRRLRQSCLYFGRPFPLSRIIHHLRELRTSLGDAPARIKLDLHFDEIETHVIRENLSWPVDGMTVMLSDRRLDPGDFRLYHKTNLRPEKYEELEKARALGATEVLFLNTRGELCEGALSNLALKINGEWLTPALHCGLLPGTWREKQLASGRLREAVLMLDDLNRAEEIRMGNAVRGEGRVVRII
jgi:para-aminobenzoate synthetase/4-amino-4-deoxychorismate lyase